MLRNMGLAIKGSRARILVNPGKANGSALNCTMAKGPRCAIADNRVVFSKRGVASVPIGRETGGNVFLSFRGPLRMPNIALDTFVEDTLRRGANDHLHL